MLYNIWSSDLWRYLSVAGLSCYITSYIHKKHFQLRIISLEIILTEKEMSYKLLTMTKMKQKKEVIFKLAQNETMNVVRILNNKKKIPCVPPVTAYLASRRGSRDSQASNLSNFSNEDIGPLNFSGHPHVRQRRTSNFLELPGKI